MLEKKVLHSPSLRTSALSVSAAPEAPGIYRAGSTGLEVGANSAGASGTPA